MGATPAGLFPLLVGVASRTVLQAPLVVPAKSGGPDRESPHGARRGRPTAFTRLVTRVTAHPPGAHTVLGPGAPGGPTLA